jgi:hypothetical protein
MRKRHVARPRLELMEDRLALSAISAHALAAAEVRADRVSKLEAKEATHATKHEHNVATEHHHATKHTHSTSKSTKSNSSSTNIFSEFFKSAFSGL